MYASLSKAMLDLSQTHLQRDCQVQNYTAKSTKSCSSQVGGMATFATKAVFLQIKLAKFEAHHLNNKMGEL